MKKFVCTYNECKSIGLTIDHQKTIEAVTAKEAYEKFLALVGVYNKSVCVSDRSSIEDIYTFKDHLAEADLEPIDKKPPTGRSEFKRRDSVNEYQKSGWTTFLKICGVLNFIICLVGLGIATSSYGQQYFSALSLMIVGLVAAINCFFFSFLVNTFTRIQHNTHLTQINTHQTTLELIKLNNKTESKD